jgi:hypothetical protein
MNLAGMAERYSSSLKLCQETVKKADYKAKEGQLF